MKLLLGLLVIGGLSAEAQVSTDVAQTSDGRSRLAVWNGGTSPITGYVASWMVSGVRSGPSATYTYRDYFIERTFNPIAPGEQHVLTVGGGREAATATQIEIRAAVFQDGSTYGDPDWAQIILKRRARYLQAVTAGLNDLQRAVADHNSSPSDVIQQMTTSRDLQLTSSKGLIPSQAYMKQLLREPDSTTREANLAFISGTDAQLCIRMVYRFLIGNIKTFPTGSPVDQPMTLDHVLNILSGQLNERKAELLVSKPTLSVTN